MLLFVNGMGGTPLIELYLAYAHAEELLRGPRHRGRGGRLVGNYITSLEMQGMSITAASSLDDEMTELWDAPVQTPRCAGVADE